MLVLALAGCGATGDRKAVALVLTNPEASICLAPSPPPAAFLIVANEPITCAQPDLPPVFGKGCGDAFWGVCVALQTLTPTTIDLQSDASNVGFAAVGAGCSSVKVGAFETTGTLAIEAVDPSTVTFAFSGANQSTIGGEVAPDGTYDAPRCP